MKGKTTARINFIHIFSKSSAIRIAVFTRVAPIARLNFDDCRIFSFLVVLYSIV